MIYAVDEDGVKVEAAKGRRAFCPTCADELVAKCGAIRVWHWSHLTRPECDPWQERESAWHLAWKARVPLERAEVCMGEHRADILACEDCVVELQHSSISANEIREREAFYGRMIWLLDGRPFQDQIRVEKRTGEVFFSWAPSRPSWFAARKPVFIHGYSVGSHVTAVSKHTGKLERQWRHVGMSDDILQILTLNRKGGVTGTARILTLERFCGRLFDFRDDMANGCHPGTDRGTREVKGPTWKR